MEKIGELGPSDGDWFSGDGELALEVLQIPDPDLDVRRTGLGGVNLEFDFRTDEEVFEFCLEIVQVMTNDFSVTTEEALTRVNYEWEGDDFEDDDLRFHESPTYWAYHIYYGKSSEWWNREGDPTLKPRPLPQQE